MSSKSGFRNFYNRCFGNLRRAVISIVLLAALAFALYEYAALRSDAVRRGKELHISTTERGEPDGEAVEPTVGAAKVPVHPMGLFAEHTEPAKRFPIESKGREEVIPNWWVSPKPLTAKEIGFQRYLSLLTWQLSRADWDRYWNVGGNQTGVQTIRFFAAFVGYAATALAMRTPAYPGLTQKILLSAIEHILDRSAWSYIELLWRDKPWFPDPAAFENIMYTGHVMQLMAFYQAISRDDKFARSGFDFVWDARRKTHYTLQTLIDVTVKQMRENPSGGVACEPKHIFFTCNTHPHAALRLLETLGYGDWSKDREKWEQFFLNSFYDDSGQGAIKCVYHQEKKLFFPIGYPGMDGWGLMWYSTWARDISLPESIWRIAKQSLRSDLFQEQPPPSRRDSLPLKGSANFVEYLSAIVKSTVPPIPAATFLYPAASACGDLAAAHGLREMIERRFLVRRNARVFLEVPHEFNIGANANMALGLALENGSNMRHFVQRQPPPEYFEGALIEDVSPADAAVFQAYRDGADLLVELESPGAVTLTLKNARAIERVEGLARNSWQYSGGELKMKIRGRKNLRIVVRNRD